MTLIKSISGIRGLIDKSLNPSMIARYAQAFSLISPNHGKILLARDTRNSGKEYIQIAINALKRINRKSIVADIVPTPTAQFEIFSKRYAGGIVFTASHNPSDWNGIKFIGPEGTFINQEVFNRLEDEFKNLSDTEFLENLDDKQIFKNESIDCINAHLLNIENLSIINKSKIKKNNFKVVIDCANGATSIALPQILKNLGCNVIKINSNYSEDFGRSPEPTPKNLSQLCSKVIETDSDIGFATDPDGDRLSIVDNKGKALGEEITLALSIFYVLKYFKEYRDAPIVTNLSTSLISEKIASKYNTRLMRSSVGEINVVNLMQKECALIGGEGNGGVILAESHLGRDSLVGAAIILNLISNESLSINELFNLLPKFYIEKSTVHLTNSSDVYIKKLKELYSNDNINEKDGLKIIRDNEWVHIRKSNTEPILRIIAESKSIERSKQLIEEIKNEIK